MFLFVFPVCVIHLFGLFSMYNFDLHLEGNMTICFCIKDIVKGFFFPFTFLKVNTMGDLRQLTMAPYSRWLWGVGENLLSVLYHIIPSVQMQGVLTYSKY